MADADDINIRLNITPGTEDTSAADKAIADVGKEAEESAERAKGLLKMITEIVNRLNGLDSGAAKALKKDLLDITAILGKIDAAPLKGVQNTISELAKRKDSLTDVDFSAFSERLRDATKDATIKVDAQVDGLVTEAARQAEDTVSKMATLAAAFSDAMGKLDGVDPSVAKAVSAEMLGLADAVDGIDSSGLDELGAAIDEVSEAARGLNADGVDAFVAKLRKATAEAKALGKSVADATKDATTQPGNAVSEVGDAAKSSADYAERLLKTITDLIARLNGMDSEAAKRLRDELASLAEIVNTLDAARLERLDSILESLAQSGAKLPAKEVEEVSKKIAKATEEAKAFKDSFSNDANVTVGVTFDAGDGLADLRERIDVTEQANELIASLNNVSGELDEIDDSAKANELRALLEETVQGFTRLDPKNVQKGAEAFERLARAVGGLSQKQRSALKSFDFAKADKQVSGLVTKIKSVKEETDKVGLATDLLQGNFAAVGTRILDLIQKTNTWQKAVAAVGKVKAGAAIAAISSAVAVAAAMVKRLLRELAKERDQLRENVIGGALQQANTARETWEYGNRARARVTKEKEAAEGEELAKFVGVREMRKAALDENRMRSLAATDGEAQREKINRNADRAMSDLDYDIEREKLDVAEKQFDRKIEDKENSRDRLEKALKSYRAASSSNGNLLGELTKDQGYWAEHIEQLKSIFGFEDVRDIEKSTEAMAKLAEMQRRAAEELKELNVDIDALKKSRTETIGNQRNALEAARKTELAKRASEDADAGRANLNANATRARTLKERARQETEADEEAERKYEDSMRGFAERQKALKDLLQRRMDERAEKQKELDALLAKNAGLEERSWSVDDKRRRDELEEDMQRLNGAVRSLRGEMRDAERTGDVENVQFVRGRSEERREREEADLAAIRQWREKIGGPLASEAVAREDVELRRRQLEESTQRRDAVAEAARKRLVKAGRVAEGEEVDFEDAKYNRMMTDEERAEYDNARADVRRDRGNLLSAGSRAAGLMADRAERVAAIRDDALKQSNRLTAMGLGGGGVVADFGKATADNTRMANELLQNILEAVKEGGAKDNRRAPGGGAATWTAM